MSTSRRIGRFLGAVLLALLVVTPGALMAARVLRTEARSPVRLDLDGDGRVERVELVRHGDDRWLDAAVEDVGGWRLVSSTRVPGADGRRWSIAVDVVAPGDVRLRVRDGSGRITSWRRDGLAFVRVTDNS